MQARQGDPTIDSVDFPPFRLDFRAERLWRDGAAIPLRPKTWTVLSYLIARPSMLVTRRELLAEIWGDTIVSDETLTRTVSELRQALGDSPATPRFIETVHRKGFRFIGAIHPSRPPSAHEGSVGTTLCTLPDEGDFVGRVDELNRLRDLLERASAGQRQFALISGEPGIGKTALIDRFVESIDASAAVVCRAQCIEQYGNQEPYMPIFKALERLLRSSAGEAAIRTLRRLAPSWLTQLVSEAAEREELQGAAADTLPARMLRELAVAFEALTREQPIVLVLEDLHWSDPATNDALSLLAQRIEPARLLIIGSYRVADAAVSRRPVIRLRDQLRLRGLCSEIGLEYLTPALITEYLSRRFGAAAIPEDLPSFVHRYTDGNPLFMTALTNHLIERGLLIHADDAWEWSAAVDPAKVAIPDDMAHLIDWQLQAASGQERALLDAASVIGREFDAELLGGVLGQSAAEAAACCERLTREHRFLRVRVSDKEQDDCDRYEFFHAVYQRFLYDALSAARRRELHCQIGVYLEGHVASSGDLAAVLSAHFRRAYDYPRAVKYQCQAGMHAHGKFAFREAIDYFHAAESILPKLQDETERARFELPIRQCLALATSTIEGYATDEVVSQLMAAHQIAEQLQDRSAQFNAAHALWYAYISRNDDESAWRFVAEVKRLAVDAGEEDRMRAAFAEGLTALWNGRLTLAETALTAALARSASPAATTPLRHGPDPFVAVCGHEGLRLWVVGEPQKARRVCQQGLQRARQLGRPLTLNAALWHAAHVALRSGDESECAKLAREAIDIADDYGFRMWHVSASVLLARAELSDDVDRAQTRMRAAVQELRQNRLHIGLAMALWFQAELYVYGGQTDEALSVIDDGLAQVEGGVTRIDGPGLLQLKGEILAGICPGKGERPTVEQVAEGRRYLEQAAASARGMAARTPELRALLALVKCDQGSPREQRSLQRLKQALAEFSPAADSPELRAARALSI